jgi:hypothetical protein
MIRADSKGDTEADSDQPFFSVVRCLIVVFRPELTLSMVNGYSRSDLILAGELDSTTGFEIAMEI